MLAVVNVSERHGIKYGSGLQKYEVRINFKVLAEVEHTFEDGAATLLRKAADALDHTERPVLDHPGGRNRRRQVRKDS